MLASPSSLAAQAPSNSILLVAGLLIVVVLIASIAVLALRKRLFAPPENGTDPGSLMDQVRAMHERGEISQDEYDRVRRRLVAQAASRTPSEKPDERGKSVDG
ncbi:MAG TPA: SHOCT domain-containing protein [Phycisphaerales bacterium]